MKNNTQLKKKRFPLVVAIAVSLLLAVSVTIGMGAIGYSANNFKEQTAQSFDMYAETSSSSILVPCSDDSSENVYYGEISYNNLLLNDGSIVRKLQIWINFNKLTDGLEGMEKETVAGKIDLTCNSIIQILNTSGFSVEEHENYLEVPLNSFESLTDMYIAYGYTGYDVDEDDDTSTETGLFFNKYYSSATSPFAGIEDSVLLDVALAMTMIPGMDIENVAFVYNYGTKYKPSLITSDADKIYYYSAEGIYIHKFVMTADTTDRTCHFTQSTPNVLAWYGFALLGTALLGGAFAALACIMNKQQRKNNNE